MDGCVVGGDNSVATTGKRLWHGSHCPHVQSLSPVAYPLRQARTVSPGGRRPERSDEG